MRAKVVVRMTTGACPRATDEVTRVGQTCVCGRHLKKCKACGESYATWENPHYVPSVGHFTPPADAIEPYYACTREPAIIVNRRQPPLG